MIKNRKDLVIGNNYLLKTWDHYGWEQNQSEWIKVTWNGQSLIDANGCTWTEWIDDSEDEVAKSVFPA